MILAFAVLGACQGDPEPTVQPPAGPPTRIAASTADITVAWPDLAFAPDGTLWVSWTERDVNDVVDVFVASSTDGGATFGPKILVDDVDQLFLGTVRQPVLAVSADRIAVTVGGGTYSNGPTILLYVASTTNPVFEGQVLDQAIPLFSPGVQDQDKTLVDQPELVFDQDGELVLNWKQGTKLESFQLVIARERDGFAISRLEDGAPGQPCECCPSDFLEYPDGELMLAFRNNDRNLREIYVGHAPAGGEFGQSSRISTNGFTLGGCPFDGPQITVVPAEGLPDGALVATWADASLGDNYQWLSVSRDRGETWSEQFLVYPDDDQSQTWPSAVTAPDGTLWLSIVEIYHGTLISTSTDLGETFTSHEPELPGGPLFFSELAAGPDGVGMIGTTESGELWYVALE